jgi:hypothetical protein
MEALTRKDILTALQRAFIPLDYALAMYEGGSAALGRLDASSDIDLQIIVQDDAVERAVARVDEALRPIAEIEMRNVLPAPTWHGHYQAFYRFKHANPLLLLDLCIIKLSNPNKFLEREIHGDAQVYFDKCNAAVPPLLDRAALQKTLRERVEFNRVIFELFSPFTQKELKRGNTIEAFVYFQGYVVGPLVELLRIRHDPAHYNFRTRHIHYDLPREVVLRLEPFYYIKDGADLMQKWAEAAAWVRQLLNAPQ